MEPLMAYSAYGKVGRSQQLCYFENSDSRCYLLSDGTKTENKNQTEILLGAPYRGLLQADPGCSTDDKCQDHGTCPLANKEASVLCAEITSCSQGRSIPLRDQNSSETHRHSLPNCTDNRFIDAA